jgi:hypothetical protein
MVNEAKGNVLWDRMTLQTNFWRERERERARERETKKDDER